MQHPAGGLPLTAARPPAPPRPQPGALGYSKPEGAVALMRELKALLDPNGILNPCADPGGDLLLAPAGPAPPPLSPSSAGGGPFFSPNRLDTPRRYKVIPPPTTKK